MSAGSSGASGGAGVDDALCVLDAALGALDAVDLHQIPAGAVGAVLVSLESARNRLDAQLLRTVERFDAAGGHELDGAASARSWVRAHLRRTPAAASRLVSTARKAQELPELTAALRAGAISQDHMRAVTSAMDRTPTRAATLAEAEPTFAAAARELDPQQLARVVRRWAHTVDPLGVVEAEQAVHAQRYLSVSSTFDGAVKIDGLLAPEPGGVLLAALEAMATSEYRQARRDGAERTDGTAGEAGSWFTDSAADRADRAAARADERTGGQRRADALVALARRFLDAGESGEIGGVRPHLLVTVAAGDLAAEPGATGHAPATLERVGPLSTEAARRIGCDATTSGVVLSATGMPLDYGRSRRVVPPWLRKVLVLRDGGCRFPGCDRPVSWCQAHHLVHWSRGGPTSVENLAMICEFHHHTVHEGGFTTTGSPQDRTLRFYRPDGTVVPDRARAP